MYVLGEESVYAELVRQRTPALHINSPQAPPGPSMCSSLQGYVCERLCAALSYQFPSHIDPLSALELLFAEGFKRCCNCCVDLSISPPLHTSCSHRHKQKHRHTQNYKQTRTQLVQLAYCSIMDNSSSAW